MGYVAFTYILYYHSEENSDLDTFVYIFRHLSNS